MQLEKQKNAHWIVRNLKIFFLRRSGFKLFCVVFFLVLIGITMFSHINLPRSGPDYSKIFQMDHQRFRGLVAADKTDSRNVSAFHKITARTLYQEAIAIHKIYRDFNEGLMSIEEYNVTMEADIKNSLPLQDSLPKDLETLVKEKRDCRKELLHMQRIIVKRIHELQNPIPCKGARKLFCVMKVGCGMGCLLHHYASCLFVALGTNRTMVLDLSLATYTDMENIFQPISRTCVGNEPTNDMVEWLGEDSDNPTPLNISVVKMSVLGLLNRHTKYTGHTIPEGILERIRGCHADPEVWWIGQIMKYLTRLKAPAQDIVEKVKDVIGFSHPIVGLHVRRSDKNKEAPYQPLDKYMGHVTMWYDRYSAASGSNVTRMVYLATDEPNLLAKLENEYPGYTFLHDPFLMQQPVIKFRFMEGGLMGTVVDTKMLAHCDCFVGTYSSNIGRLVYELMQADGERTFDSTSLDKSYYYLGGYPKYYEAIEDYYPREGDMELKTGDLLEYDWELYSKFKMLGLNHRSNRTGYYPKHRVRRVHFSSPYPGIS